MAGRNSAAGFVGTESSLIRLLLARFGRIGRRDRALFLAMYNTGARVSEVIGLIRCATPRPHICYRLAWTLWLGHESPEMMHQYSNEILR